MYGYDDDLDAEQCKAMQDATDASYTTSVMGPSDAPPESGVFPKGPTVEPPPESGVYPKPLNPNVDVPGRPVDDPVPEYQPEPPEMPPDPGPPPSSPPEPLQPPETYPEFDPNAVPEGPAEGGELATEGTELATEGTELAEGAELAEGGALMGEALPVAAAGVAGYEVGSAIAPYVYGDKNLDGSPVIKHENVEDIDTNYKDSWAYKINQWLDD
jgi:hypothetical protein